MTEIFSMYLAEMANAAPFLCALTGGIEAVSLIVAVPIVPGSML
jgi:hypothetical protein